MLVLNKFDDIAVLITLVCFLYNIYVHQVVTIEQRMLILVQRLLTRIQSMQLH